MNKDKINSETFYVSADLIEKNPNNVLVEKFKDYSDRNNEQVYLLKKPLLERDIEYDYDLGGFLLIPNYKICFINFSNDDNDEFEDYSDDVISDLESLVKEYGYLPRIGRKRKWSKRLITKLESTTPITTNDIIENLELVEESDQRDVNILISLLIGSINSVDKIGDNVPQTELEKIKQKIILFDGEQTRFIFENVNKAVLNVQGLAGTGKTELLFHKLKELYLENESNKIAFTCYNKILSNSLGKRVPEFFSYMRVNEQIEWNKRLWVMPAWGSQKDTNSGLYSYITSYYNLTFNRYDKYYMGLDKACDIAINELENTGIINPCFDYILIDESQDFPESFFKLCEKVVKKQVIKVGDIFQNITDTVPSKNEVDILLNRCYRTDNRNLMFSHALSMGLFEKNKKRWFKKDEWKTIGYKYDKLNDNKVRLSRTPTKRFDDVENSENPFTQIIKCNNDIKAFGNTSILNNEVINVIKRIYSLNPKVEPNDIAVVFLNNGSRVYDLTNNLKIKLFNELGIKSNFGYDSKEVKTDSLFITNRYNVKGLEFPFVICVENEGIREDLASRNALYMAMTRSFISSYLIVENIDEQLYSTFEKEIEKLSEENALIINEPTKEEIEEIEESSLNLKVNDYLSLKDAIELILNKYKISDKEKREKINLSTINTFPSTSFNYEKVEKHINHLLKSVYNDEQN